jgi:signal transduction histidine kinase
MRSDALGRAITVLLDNAMKATAAGGQIHVSSTMAGECQHQSAIIAVRDTGSGIPREEPPHIFDRFYRVNKDRSRETGSAGLGLSISQWIVARHGGTIEVESERGHESTFRIVLPLDVQQHCRSEILQNQNAN